MDKRVGAWAAPEAEGFANRRALEEGHGGLGGVRVSLSEVARAAALELVASEHITVCFFLYACTSEDK